MITTLLLLFFSVIAGVAIVRLFKPEKNPKALKLLVAFSGAFLLSVTFLHLLPEVFESHDHFVGVMILSGFVFQVLLEWLTSGIEHGHYHAKPSKEGLVPFSVMIGLFLHAFFEGIPILTQSNEVSARSLLLGIVIHNIPVSMILYIMLLRLQISKTMVYTVILIFALAAPIAAVAGAYFDFTVKHSNYITAFVIGIFFHVSTTILFESSENHRFNFTKILTVIAAGIFAWLSVQH
jgi:zinc transporter ZupT